MKYPLITIPLTLFCTSAIAAEQQDIKPQTVEQTTASTNAVSNIRPDTAELPTPVTTEQMQARLSEARGTDIKIDANGKILTSDSERWDCLHQKSNGLTWEIKTDSGLRGKTNTYTWIESDSDHDSLFSWFDHKTGKCTGEASCETSSYTATINQLKLCGFSDWRLPTKDELNSLVKISADSDKPAIDTTYFPNAQPSWYWTSDSNDKLPEYAWYVLFRQNGLALNDIKNNPKHVRLVRGNIQG